MQGTHTAYIGIGSNQGDRLDVCRKAIDVLSDGGGSCLQCQSRFYETEPVGWEDQAWFVNTVISIRTGLEAQALHKKLQAVEGQFGRRTEGPRFGPRILDLDLLFFDDLVVKTASLEVPHPRLHERRFVLQPLCDIAPGLVHPVIRRTARQLLSDLGDKKRVMPLT